VGINSQEMKMFNKMSHKSSGRSQHKGMTIGNSTTTFQNDEISMRN